MPARFDATARLPTIAAACLLAGCVSNPPAPVAFETVEPGPGRVVAAPPDELGRQLHDAPHRMELGSMDELRARVPTFAGLSDREIMRYMQLMGPNYAWYLSDPALRAPYGVVVLAHGFRDRGDRLFAERLQPVADERPTALALGMSMAGSDHVQVAIDDVEAAGAKDIVVVPAVSTRHNTMLRQWRYILGLADEPAYASVPRVGSRARLHLVPPLDDHPLAGDILVDYAAGISTNPAAEELIIVAHGPEHAADNREQLAMLGRLADYVAARSDYAAIRVATLQDDAPREVRLENVLRLRGLVREAAERGRTALIVTNLLGTRTVQSQLRRDLRGLDYRFNPKGLVQHENFVRWIEASVTGTVARLD